VNSSLSNNNAHKPPSPILALTDSGEYHRLIDSQNYSKKKVIEHNSANKG
jgi:hypothetical protein